MRTLITGSTGFIGQHLARRLRQSGREVLCWNRHQDLGAAFAARPEVVYHLAAETKAVSEMFDSNVVLTQTIISRCEGVRLLVYVGSSAEYAKVSHPLSEADRLDPVTVYEGTKAAASMLVQGFARQGALPFVIARPFSVYGPGEPATKFISCLFRAAREDRPIDLVPDARHDWLFVNDFVEGLLAIEGQRPEPGEVFNFGTGVQHTNSEVVEILSSLLGKTIRVGRLIDPRPHDSASWVCDPVRTRARLGWATRHDLRTGLMEMLKLVRY